MAQMAKETKFGYGFWFAGIGVPYLLDQMFGKAPAFWCAVVFTVIGAGLLLAGHQHKEEGEVPLTNLKKAFGYLVMVVLLAGLTVGIVKFRPESHEEGNISQINDAEFFDAVAAWGVHAPIPGSTSGGGEAYEDINTARLIPFRKKYDLMVVVRVHDTHLSAYRDSDIQKSNPFPIPAMPPTTMRITINIPASYLASHLAAGNGEMEFVFCLIPHTLDASTIVNLDDITARGGHVFQPGRGGGMSVGPTVLPIPLAPPSSDAHSVISETFVGVTKNESRHDLTIEIHLVAATDVQVHAVAKTKFMFRGKPIAIQVKDDAVAMDFMSRNQSQAVSASLTFSPLDWSDFISGSAPLTVQIPVEYKDRGVRMRYLITGTINSNSDQLADLKTEWIKLP